MVENEGRMDMHIGWIGGIGGTVLGLAGGVVGTWFSIRNTNGPRERAFMVKSAAVTWLAIGVFLAVLLLAPTPWRFLVWIPYAILLPLGIWYFNRVQQRIREEESSEGGQK
jgi:uncharacterized membrane protein YfcA